MITPYVKKGFDDAMADAWFKADMEKFSEEPLNVPIDDIGIVLYSAMYVGWRSGRNLSDENKHLKADL